jgi:type IV pilus assembly protein PilV
MAGVTLIEVLVAVLVLSVGLLGYAALLAFSLKANQSANFRTQATVLAYEALDMIRANRVNAQFYRRDWNWSAPTATGPSAASATQAIADISAWVERVGPRPGQPQRPGQLPGGQARIQLLAAPIFPPVGTGPAPPTPTAADRGVVVVSIRWQDARWEATAANQRTEFQVRSRL